MSASACYRPLRLVTNSLLAGSHRRTRVRLIRLHFGSLQSRSGGRAGCAWNVENGTQFRDHLFEPSILLFKRAHSCVNRRFVERIRIQPGREGSIWWAPVAKVFSDLSQFGCVQIWRVAHFCNCGLNTGPGCAGNFSLTVHDAHDCCNRNSSFSCDVFQRTTHREIPSGKSAGTERQGGTAQTLRGVSYSWRRALTGSTEAARRAGINPARSAVVSKVPIATARASTLTVFIS